MVAMFLFRSAGRSASLLSRYQCRTMKASGIAASSNRYLTSSSSSSSGSGNINNPSEASKTSLANLNLETSSNDPKQGPPTATKSVYVHPLSQVVLLQLQSDECYEWMKRAGLDGHLTVHRDGTFSLETPPTTTHSNDTADADTNNTSANPSSRIWTAYDPDEKKHWLMYTRSTGGRDSNGNNTFSEDDDRNAVAAATTPTGVRERFLLQDNEKSAWNDEKTSLHVRVQEWVSELMLTAP
jgi:hypothetical protein